MIEIQFQQLTTTAAQQNLVNPAVVIAWLGKDLETRVEREVSSYQEMDNFVQLLSSERIRKILAGDKETLNNLTFAPESLTKLQGQDVRKLWRENKITLKAIIKIAKDISNPIKRQLPSWIEDNIELQNLANQFTDNQLTILGQSLAPGIKAETELKISFFRAFLSTLSIINQMHISECKDADFSSLVIVRQNLLLETLIKNGGSLAQNMLHGFNFTNANDVYNALIKKYLSEYQKPHVSIPTDPVLKQQALEATLRNAANSGNIWDLAILVSAVKNINAIAPSSGKTALHRAAEYANKFGNRLCYDFLLKQPTINPNIHDKSNKTAADLLSAPKGFQGPARVYN